MVEVSNVNTIRCVPLLNGIIQLYKNNVSFSPQSQPLAELFRCCSTTTSRCLLGLNQY